MSSVGWGEGKTGCKVVVYYELGTKKTGSQVLIPLIFWVQINFNGRDPTGCFGPGKYKRDF